VTAHHSSSSSLTPAYLSTPVYDHALQLMAVIHMAVRSQHPKVQRAPSRPAQLHQAGGAGSLWLMQQQAQPKRLKQQQRLQTQQQRLQTQQQRLQTQLQHLHWLLFPVSVNHQELQQTQSQQQLQTQQQL